jgi:DUF1680 family protein
MKRAISLLLAVALTVSAFTAMSFNSALAADPGEDISLIAHYPFAGDANDTQRNLYNATLSGTGATFANDDEFGTILNLAGGSKGTSAAIIPGQALIGVGSITVATWVYPRGTTTYARIFDFGRSQTNNFYLTTRYSGSSFSARFTIAGSGGEQTAAATSALSVNTWHHVAVTINEATKVMSLYRDGELIATRTLTAGLKDVLSQTSGAANLLYIGRSQYGDSDINAKISDFRIYDRDLSLAEIQAVRAEKFSDDAVVASDLRSITNQLGVLQNRTDNFTLPTSTSSGSTVVWTSSNNVLINAQTGVVTRPPNTSPNQTETATLHVVVTKGEAKAESDIVVTVLRLPTDGEIVANDKAALTIPTGLINADIPLPPTGDMGSAITWVSGAPNYISSTGAVTRPAPDEGDKPVTLTATIRYGTASDTKTFELIVKHQTDVPVLIGVPDIRFASPKGELPALPYYIPGIYKDGKDGPPVRVIWPAPTNANAYQNVGEAEIKGTVSGTSFAPTAYVTITETDNAIDYHTPSLSFAIYGDDSVPAGATPKSSVAVLNNGESAANIKVIMALYDKDGRLAGDTQSSLTVAPKERKTLDISLPPVEESDCSVKVFAWDENTFEPLSETFDIAAEDALPEIELEKFNLSQVVLDFAENGNQTVFQRNYQNMLNGLLNANDDRFLYMFRQTFSIPQPAGASALGGWDTESTKLRGHATGHYLSALAQAYSGAAYDPAIQARLKTKMDYMIDTLYDISKLSQGDPASVPIAAGKTAYTSELTAATARKDYENWGRGFISAYPPDQLIMLESYATYGSGNNQIWAPYYTLHKILAGLVDCYEVAGSEKALEIAENMGLWVYDRLSKCTQAQLTRMWGIYIAGEYGGMNETLAKLYDITGDERFIKTAQAFDNYGFFFGTTANNYTDGLASNVDTIRTRHANQHLPQITGALATYDGTKDIKYYNVASNFWDKTVNSYTYSIGSNGGLTSNSECFNDQPDKLYGNGLPATGNKDSSESCATYNMLKLSTQLFMHEPDAKYMDYYERALYNDIAASISPTNAGNAYFFPLTPGAIRSYGNAQLTGFSCCNGTATESHTKYQDSIYLHDGDETLYVNLYIPSTLKWNDDVSISQTTNYPYSDTTNITVNGSGSFDMKLRIPYWAESGVEIYVNDEKQGVVTKPSSYVSINRAWSYGDTVKLVMPMDFHLYETMNQPNIASIFYGPIVMAGTETAALTTYRPITLDAENLANSITGDASSLRFTTNGRSLQPLYDFGTTRYSTYFDVTLDQ